MIPTPPIEVITEMIVRHLEPRRIILFGSRAAGSFGPDSDIDLLVEMGTRIECAPS